MSRYRKRRSTVGEASAEEFRVLSDTGEAVDPGLGIFPIVEVLASGSVLVVGTGFFIAQQGVFATAAHNLTDSSGKPFKALAAVQFMPENKFYIRPFRSVTRHDQFDVAVGVLFSATHNVTGAQMPNKAMVLSQGPVAVGTKTSSYAFPLTTTEPGSPQSIYFEPGFYTGVVEEHYDFGRDKVLLPGPCYQTSMVIHGGASGGPVVGPNGSVFAINSTGFGDESLSFVSCISGIYDLTLHGVAVQNGANANSTTVREMIAAGVIGVR